MMWGRVSTMTTRRVATERCATFHADLRTNHPSSIYPRENRSSLLIYMKKTDFMLVSTIISRSILEYDHNGSWKEEITGRMNFINASTLCCFHVLIHKRKKTLKHLPVFTWFPTLDFFFGIESEQSEYKADAVSDMKSLKLSSRTKYMSLC
ncbi:hypothetical protein GQ43DRAFT_97473 [Delitschia confertaspora ATCC 74209]|uniref:Uncharacterized protein n=1 Tax=Delitschia confertaspora ATCC 74209 TaxID=1513339 RepID=A0A9P4JKP6_9PLEO|nr:hypothetical protein GQ43DRAFT_97473 [Delitschia confertaspora ATCC 74209]